MQKDTLINHDEVSPVQLIFGENTNLPSAINYHLPASEWYIQSTDLVHQISLFFPYG